MESASLYVSLTSSLLSGAVGAGLGAYVSTRALRRTDNRTARRALVFKLAGQLPELATNIDWVRDLAMAGGEALEVEIESLEIVDQWIDSFEQSRVQAIAYCRPRFVRAFEALATLLVEYRDPLMHDKDGSWHGYLFSPETTAHVAVLHPKLDAAVDKFGQALVREARRD